MSEVHQQLTEASNLRKAGKFKQAYDRYRSLWHDHEDEFDRWHTWGYAKSAQKCGKHEDAERVAKLCVERWPDFPQGRHVLAWCLYYRYFQHDASHERRLNQTILDAAENVALLCADDVHSMYAPCVRVVLRACLET